MAIKKKAVSVLKKNAGRESAGAAPDEDEDGEGEGESEASPKAKAKAGVEAAPNEELVGLFESYDEAVEKAEKIFVELVELIQDQQLDRATVVASMMQARGMNYESAQTQYSRMKKIFNNEEVLQELKDGKITLKVARERTKGTQKNPAAAKPAAKEAKYLNTLKAFVAAAKESGFQRAEIIVSVTAELKAAGIK